MPNPALHRADPTLLAENSQGIGSKRPEGEDKADDRTGKLLVLTVRFTEEVWEALSGGGKRSFREVVAFELSDDTLRVICDKTKVLELALTESSRVDEKKASAKLSGKTRQVVVRAPLLARTATPAA